MRRKWKIIFDSTFALFASVITLVHCKGPQLRNGEMDNYLQLQNYRIFASNSYAALIADSECHCKLMCYSSEDCKSASARDLDETFECRLSNKTFHEVTEYYYTDRQSVSFFWIEYAPTVYYELGSDKKMYMATSELMTYQSALEFCKPPFRLAVTESSAHKQLLDSMTNKTGTDLFVNLKKDEGEPVKWCTNVKYTDSEVESVVSLVEGGQPKHYYVYSNDTFKPVALEAREGVLCQSLGKNPHSACD